LSFHQAFFGDLGLLEVRMILMTRRYWRSLFCSLPGYGALFSFVQFEPRAARDDFARNSMNRSIICLSVRTLGWPSTKPGGSRRRTIASGCVIKIVQHDLLHGFFFKLDHDRMPRGPIHRGYRKCPRPFCPHELHDGFDDEVCSPGTGSRDDDGVFFVLESRSRRGAHDDLPRPVS